jgi:hypothetical protein
MSTFTIQINCAEPPPDRSIDLYSRWGDTSNYDYDMYYQIDSNSAVYWGTVNSTSCGNLDTVLVPDGSTLYVYALNASTAEQVYIRGAASSTCPANAAFYCVYDTVITADGSVAITVYVDGNGDPQYCT